MSESIFRPKADKKKIHSKNEFELCYLRHQYFRRSTANPSEKDMKPYLTIIKHSANNTFYTYKNLFHAVGFDVEDVISIGQVHLVSYLGLFSMEKMPAKYDEYIRIIERTKNHIPSKKEILEKNKANFTLFLKQRMEELVRVCRQKARNIKGYPVESFYIYYGQQRPPKILRNLINHNEEYGYRKLDLAVFKSIRKHSGVQADAKSFKWNDTWYVCVPIEQRSLKLVDFSGADLDPYDNIHNRNPEQVYFTSQEEKYWKVKKKKFEHLSAAEKARQIRSFIAKYEDRPAYSDEIKAAKKWLTKLEI